MACPLYPNYSRCSPLDVKYCSTLQHDPIMSDVNAKSSHGLLTFTTFRFTVLSFRPNASDVWSKADTPIWIGSTPEIHEHVTSYPVEKCPLGVLKVVRWRTDSKMYWRMSLEFQWHLLLCLWHLYGRFNDEHTRILIWINPRTHIDHNTVFLTHPLLSLIIFEPF